LNGSRNAPDRDGSLLACAWGPWPDIGVDYPDDVDDRWEEDGVLTKLGIDEVHEMFDHMCQRTVPQLYGPPGAAREVANDLE
jgi:hypothetical protein